MAKVEDWNWETTQTPVWPKDVAALQRDSITDTNQLDSGIIVALFNGDGEPGGRASKTPNRNCVSTCDALYELP